MNEASGSKKRVRGPFSSATGASTAPGPGHRSLDDEHLGAERVVEDAVRSSSTRLAGSQPLTTTRWSDAGRGVEQHGLPRSGRPGRGGAPRATVRWRRRSRATASSAASRRSRRPRDVGREPRPELVERDAGELRRKAHLLEVPSAEQGAMSAVWRAG